MRKGIKKLPKSQVKDQDCCELKESMIDFQYQKDTIFLPNKEALCLPFFFMN